MVGVFIQDDDGFVSWRDSHPDAFVLNSSLASPVSSSHVLHRSTCWTINRSKPAHGDRWTHEYLKACGAASEVIRFAVAVIGKRPNPCGHCDTEPVLAAMSAGTHKPA